jgi:hypothetical protein
VAHDIEAQTAGLVLQSREQPPPVQVHAGTLQAHRAVSTGGRDESFESFGWSIPLESHAWASVEFSGDEVKAVLGVDG